MPANATLQAQKEAAVKAEVQRLVQARRVAGSSIVWEQVFEQVAAQFFLKPRTVEQIFSGYYDNRRRPKEGADPTPAT